MKYQLGDLVRGKISGMTYTVISVPEKGDMYQIKVTIPKVGYFAGFETTAPEENLILVSKNPSKIQEKWKDILV